MIEQIIRQHPAAPAKPPLGATCNGCGVCCLAETCPLARLRFMQRTGPCPALEWLDTGTKENGQPRYACGLLRHPANYLGWLPAMAVPLVQRLCRRWIAAGIGCDCDAEVPAEPLP